MTIALKTARRDGDIDVAEGVVLPPAALRAVERWAQQKPQALALLHKQHGRWGAYRWSDVARTVAQLRDALARRGLGPGSRLAVSGALEPRLILLVLAAHGAGATVVAIDRHAQGTALQERLRAAAPTHAFVQERKTISEWIDSGHVNAAPVPLYSAQSVAHDSGSWHIAPLAELAGPASAPAVAGRQAKVRGHAALWVDEGTEWHQGLEQVLADWLHSGTAMAAPESSASSTRDRREIQPWRLLVSVARRQQLQAELQARLPLPGSWRRRLTERAAARPGGLLARWLLGRISRLHGLPVRQGPGEISTVLAKEVSA